MSLNAADLATSSLELPHAIRLIDVPPDAPLEFRAGIMTAGDLGFFVGKDGSMKSTLALLLAGAIAGNYPFLGHFDPVAGQVLIVSEEDSAAVIQNRVEAMCRGMDWSRASVLRNVHVIACEGVRLTSAAWRAHLLAEIAEIRPLLVILDPLAELMTGEENSNSEARSIVQTMRSLAGPSGANVLPVHHFGKPAEGKAEVDLIRGASAFRSASRFTYAIDHDEAAHELKVKCLKLSRSKKLPPFVVRYHIESDSSNPAVWTLARFEYVSAPVAALERAEDFVLDQLQAGNRMNTSQLKQAAVGTGVSGADIARALKTLETRRLIDFIAGSKNAKQWGVCGEMARAPGQPGQPEHLIAGQPESLPGNQSSADLSLPSPDRGRQAEGTDGPAAPPQSWHWEPDETQVAALEAEVYP